MDLDAAIDSIIDLNKAEKKQLKIFCTCLHEGWSLTYARSMSKTLVISNYNKPIVNHPFFQAYVKKYSRMYNSDNRKTLFPKTENYKKKSKKLY